ncbi:MAG: hypothetical protein PHS14_00290 [Elusimicrobia bacterium]|nr:hypothetical protein [Elusimicrobiota bacterium]
MTTATWFQPLLQREAARRRRYVRDVERLGSWGQILMLLRSDVSIHTGSLVDANHGQPTTFTWGRPVALTVVRLEWMFQDNPRRPCIGWRLWLYTKPRAFHLDLVLRLGRP